MSDMQQPSDGNPPSPRRRTPVVWTHVHNADEISARVGRTAKDLEKLVPAIEQLAWMTIEVNREGLFTIFARTERCQRQLQILAELINRSCDLATEEQRAD
jgi:hypothetical protein